MRALGREIYAKNGGRKAGEKRIDIKVRDKETGPFINYVCGIEISPRIQRSTTLKWITRPDEQRRIKT